MCALLSKLQLLCPKNILFCKMNMWLIVENRLELNTKHVNLNYPDPYNFKSLLFLFCKIIQNYNYIFLDTIFDAYV